MIAFTGTGARETVFRPRVEIAGDETLVLGDQLAAVDLLRLTERRIVDPR